MVDPVDFSWEAIRAAFPVGETTAEMVGDFLRRPEVEHLVQVSTKKALNRWSIDLSEHREEFANDCRTLIFLILTDPAARASAERIRNGLATAVYVKFVDRVKAHIESVDWTGFRGQSTRIRRVRALTQHASRMRDELGREPTRSEIIASYNAHVAASRSDAARQGMVASEEDLIPVTPVSFDPTIDVPAASHDDDMPLMTVEARPLLEAVLRRATAMGGHLSTVVRSWLGHFDEAPPYISSVAQIVAETGLSERQVRLLLAPANQLCRTVLAEEFGITEDDW